MIGVSALLNFRMGFRAADTVIDGWAYGLAAAFGDGLKALAPFVAYWGWQRRDPLAVLASVILFVVITAYSFTAAVGFAELHRTARQAERLTAIDGQSELRKDLARVDERLKTLGVQRSEGEVTQAIAAKFAMPVVPRGRTLDEWTQGCSHILRPETRGPCAEVAELRQELERSREQQRLVGERVNIRERLGGMNAPVSADPQIKGVVHALGLVGLNVDAVFVETCLSLLVALLIEVGSGVGVYASTTPWRGGPLLVANNKPPMQTPLKRPGREGEVRDFVAHAVEPVKGNSMSCDEAWTAYGVWCRSINTAKKSRQVFERELANVLGELGVVAKGEGGGRVYSDVGLTRP